MRAAGLTRFGGPVGFAALLIVAACAGPIVPSPPRSPAASGGTPSPVSASPTAGAAVTPAPSQRTLGGVPVVPLLQSEAGAHQRLLDHARAGHCIRSSHREFGPDSAFVEAEAKRAHVESGLLVTDELHAWIGDLESAVVGLKAREVLLSVTYQSFVWIVKQRGPEDTWVGRGPMGRESEKMPADAWMVIELVRMRFSDGREAWVHRNDATEWDCG